MDKLTSQLENYFAVDDEAEGASTTAASQAATTEDESSMIDTSDQ